MREDPVDAPRGVGRPGSNLAIPPDWAARLKPITPP
jgi:hypothetical protein